MSRQSDRGKTLDYNELTLTGQPAEPSVRPSLSDRSYLVVFEHNTSSMFPLPVQGMLTIGRVESAELRLEDNAVSRRHAEILIKDGQVSIRDLGSRNGTHVNGERVLGIRLLVPGDIIVICSTMLAFHSSSSSVTKRVIQDLPALRQRIEEELERSLSYHRTFALIAAELGTTPVDPLRLSQALENQLRLIDIAAWDGPQSLFVLVPEADPEAGAAFAARLRDVLAPEVRQVRVGFATCPTDGAEVDGLLDAARQAAVAAAAGEVTGAQEIYQTLAIGGEKIIVAEAAMQRLYTLVERLAEVDLPVLICGETGTGKELVACSLHHKSKRHANPLLTVNCAAIQENLLESELFGYEKGAFSGAVGSKPGLLETAHRGTVFLDEIAELSASAQAKLLRVLETKRVTRLGDVSEREIDIRIIGATNRNLDAEVRAGRFRQDFFYRLSGAMLWLPPLRERKRELRILAQAFLRDACLRAEKPLPTLSKAAMDKLCAYPWPGNIRELKNTMQYLAAAVTEPVLRPWHLSERIGEAHVPPGFPRVRREKGTDAGAGADAGSGADPFAAVALDGTRKFFGVGATHSEGDATSALEPAAGASPQAPTGNKFRPVAEEMRDLERERMASALAATGGHKTRAAELIGMPLRTFLAKLKQYGLGVESRRPR